MPRNVITFVPPPSGCTDSRLKPGLPGGVTNVITFLGTPNFHYALERTASLTPPPVWVPQVTNAAQPNGFLSFTNVSPPPAFYRTRYVP